MNPARPLLFIADNFPPVIGGSATVYDRMCRHNADLVVALSSTATYTRRNKTGVEQYDAACGFVMYRRRFLRTPVSLHPGGVRGRLEGLWHEVATFCGIALQVARICRRHRVRAVCVGELVYGGWLVLLARYALGLKTMVYTHGEEITQQSPGVFSRLRGFFLRRAHVIVAVSRFCRDAMVERCGVDPATVRVILNGVDTDRFVPAPASTDKAALRRERGLEGRVILAAGRHSERKGFDHLLRCLPEVLRQVPEARLLLAGDGPETPFLRRLAADLGLEERVSFLGAVDDAELVRLYQLADVFAMPNRTLADGDTEGFGLVFLEANACGTAVVGGRAGGAVEAVRHGETGLSVDATDPANIAQALVRILADDTLRQSMEAAGLEFARQSSWPGRAREFRALVEELVGP